MHSHINSIPKNDFEIFNTPCTGRGPINASLSTLTIGYDEAIWQLLCLELDRFVKVESISGGPYHRLEQISTSGQETSIDCFSMQPFLGEVSWHTLLFEKYDFRLFLIYLIKTKKLKFSYNNGCYALGMSFIDAVLLISNEFITWYNNFQNSRPVEYIDLVQENIITECIIKNGKIYLPDGNRGNSIGECRRYIGKKICTFKGREIVLTIDGILSSDEDSLNKTRILNLQYIEAIIFRMLKILNCYYGR